jgi:hypothetical protein
MILMPGSLRDRHALLSGGVALIVGLPTRRCIDVHAEQPRKEHGHATDELATGLSAVLTESINERRSGVVPPSDTRPFRREPQDDRTFRRSLERLPKSHPQYSEQALPTSMVYRRPPRALCGPGARGRRGRGLRAGSTGFSSAISTRPCCWRPCRRRGRARFA